VRIFRFIVAKRAEHSITIMCRVLEVSRSGFHAWAAREPSARAVADECFWREGMAMLRLVAAQAETLWDEALPVEVRELPSDLAALDGLLADPGLMAPFAAHWDREAAASGRSAAGHGRPTIAIETYVRLMGSSQDKPERCSRA
jgi:hypothetical protein